MREKNLLIFHLESIDSLHFRWNEEYFPNINSFMKDCVDIKYHYSNATSTFMSMNDILYGDDWYRYEDTVSFGNKIDLFGGRSESLLAYYESKGYATRIIEYPESAGHFNIKGVMRNKDEQFISTSREELYEEIEKLIQKDKFAIYVWDASSHLNCSDENQKNYKGGYERRIQGYVSIDRTFGEVISKLKKYRKLEDTVIVIFGDHGDDYWYHGLEAGYVHGTPPYANIIITPLLIYDGKTVGKDTQHIIATIDIGIICKELTGGSCTTADAIKAHAKKYAFSRNLFAAQRKSKYGFRLTKAYAVANTKYLLLLTNDGYEMYYVNLDIENATNILDFFHVVSGKIRPFRLYGFMTRHRIIHFHFINLINTDEIRDIQKNFQYLRMKMTKELDTIYGQAVEKQGQIKNIDCVKINYKKRYYREITSMLFRGIYGRLKQKFVGESVWNETI